MQDENRIKITWASLKENYNSFLVPENKLSLKLIFDNIRNYLICSAIWYLFIKDWSNSKPIFTATELFTIEIAYEYFASLHISLNDQEWIVFFQVIFFYFVTFTTIILLILNFSQTMRLSELIDLYIKNLINREEQDNNIYNKFLKKTILRALLTINAACWLVFMIFISTSMVLWGYSKIT